MCKFPLHSRNSARRQNEEMSERNRLLCVKYMEQVLWEFRDKMVKVEWAVLERTCGGGELKRHA